jgi:hypothetical protein
MTVEVRGLEIITQGSVNIQTEEIDLVASIPVKESWFKGKDGIFASLKGQSIQIPIKGTLNRPPELRGMIGAILRQTAGSAVRGLLNNPLERGQQLLNQELQQGQGLLQRELGQGQPQGQTGQAQGQGFLQRELGQGLNRLFGPQQPATPAAPPVPATRPR